MIRCRLAIRIRQLVCRFEACATVVGERHEVEVALRTDCEPHLYAVANGKFRCGIGA